MLISYPVVSMSTCGEDGIYSSTRRQAMENILINIAQQYPVPNDTGINYFHVIIIYINDYRPTSYTVKKIFLGSLLYLPFAQSPINEGKSLVCCISSNRFK